MATSNRSSSKNQPAGRYSKGGTTEEFENRLGFWNRKILTQDASDTVITITPKYHNRPDLLAHDAYGRSTYAWVILQYNNILDPVTEFVVGASISLPSAQRILHQFT